MNKKMVFALTALTTILVLTTFANSALATSYTKVGVSPGSSSIYLTKFSSVSVNKTVITIYAVIGTGVYENVTYYNPDNTVNTKKNIGPIDVNANSYGGMQSVIASGLTTNDPVYPGAPYKINDSSLQIVAGAIRTINHFKMGVFSSDYIEIWWDKDTGIMVGFNWYYFGNWENLTMIATTAWLPLGQSIAPAIALAGVIGIIALVVGVLIGRHSMRKSFA